MKLNQTSVEDYINQFPDDTKKILNRIRKIVLKGNKNIEEKMAYGMPAYHLNKKPLVYFTAMKNHIGFYATPAGHEKFKEKLAGYKHGKGSVQFPFTEKIPFALIDEIVQFRVEENLKL